MRDAAGKTSRLQRGVRHLRQERKPSDQLLGDCCFHPNNSSPAARGQEDELASAEKPIGKRQPRGTPIAPRKRRARPPDRGLLRRDSARLTEASRMKPGRNTGFVAASRPQFQEHTCVRQSLLRPAPAPCRILRETTPRYVASPTRAWAENTVGVKTRH